MLTNKIYFRNSNNEWVWEFELNKKNLNGTYRYSGKNKFFMILNFGRYSSSLWKDYFFNGN